MIAWSTAALHRAGLSVVDPLGVVLSNDLQPEPTSIRTVVVTTTAERNRRDVDAEVARYLALHEELRGE